MRRFRKVHGLLFSSFLCCLSPCRVKGQGVITGLNITPAHRQSSWSAAGKCQPDIECWLSIRTRQGPSLNEISQDLRSFNSSWQGHTTNTMILVVRKQWHLFDKYECMRHCKFTLFCVIMDLRVCLRSGFRNLVIVCDIFFFYTWDPFIVSIYVLFVCICMHLHAVWECVWMFCGCLKFYFFIFLYKIYGSIFQVRAWNYALCR